MSLPVLFYYCKNFNLISFWWMKGHSSHTGGRSNRSCILKPVADLRVFVEEPGCLTSVIPPDNCRGLGVDEQFALYQLSLLFLVLFCTSAVVCSFNPHHLTGKVHPSNMGRSFYWSRDSHPGSSSGNITVS